ncbi:MAG: amino acid adenylation domain-containing protein [Ruminococcus sp.]|nr:amino acid adenylation domain-containing protein [Ruminococcus sp.]
MELAVQKLKEIIRQYPDHPAVVESDNNLFTYREMSEYALKIAGKLTRCGVKPRDFVLITLPRGKEYVAAMYGVWLAGAGFAPLSETYPLERITYIRDDCKASVVIDERFLRRIENEEPLAQEIIPDEADPAVLIYTSGSTGKPKGVLHSHLSVSDAVCRYLKDYCPMSVGYRSALGASFTFVVAVGDVFAPLCAGAGVYLMPYEAIRDPELLADYIEQNQINRTWISPKMLKVFQNKGDSLKLVHTGSERVSELFSDEFQILVGYGQTESAGAVMMFPIDKKYDNTPIGKPIGDVKAYLLDETDQPADEGELCLAGHFATGYLNLPEQTAETFADNPFYEQDGCRTLLRTGDICRKDENGNFIYLNRKDWMVKINGQRVEPGEIEAIIKNTDGIFDCAVKDFKNHYGQVYLVAYYVEKEPVEAEDIRQAITEKLPSYMIPSFFVKLDRLPVNMNGKLDRGALKAPEAGAFKNEYTAPSTDLQKALCAAFEKVLGVERVGIDDDFFALGGDSIRSTLVVKECSVYFVSIKDIFDGKTPRGIEKALIKKASAEKTRHQHKALSCYPLTPAERGVYIEQKLNENSTVYNLNIAVSLKGCDATTAIKALNAVFAAHEAFRSYYGEQNGVPVRIMAEELPVTVEKSAASWEEVKEIVDNYAVPFDLNEEIPVRPTLYTLPDGSLILHLAIHHIAFDGSSAPAFIRELSEAIGGNLPKADQIDLSDLYDKQEDPKNGLAFYKELFKDGVPVNEMPIKGKRPKVHPTSDRLITFDMDRALLSAIGKTARRFKATEFELLFSAVAMTLGQYTASEDVVLGIPTNMRPAGAENVIGMFVNTAPVRIRVPRDSDTESCIGSVREAVRSATYGASLPFEDVVAEFVKQRDESRNPIFDVSVNYLWMPEAYQNDGLSVDMYSPLQKMSRDIGIVMYRRENKLSVTVQYSSLLFEDEVAENFVSQFRNTVRLLVKGASTVREALALPDEQEKKLIDFSVEGTSEIPVKLLHKLFEDRAAETPDRTALIAVDGTYTYRELNEKANGAANLLIERGIKPGDSIALLLPRTSAFLVCMFGVNKAGAAFIPCDPQYPADRINHIITDSGASFIVTTKDKLGDYSPEKAIDIEDLLTGGNIQNPNVSIDSSALSYMIYTSGSTGKPKGVMLTHEGICNYLYPHPANRHIYALKNDIDTYLSVTTVSFDMSFKEHAATLCNGKTLVFAGDDQMNDPRELAKLMEDYKVDCINATPSRLAQYMEYPPFVKALASCKVIMSGGEAYPLSLRDSIKAAAPDASIINTYGPTEITVSCNGACLNDAQYITVGRPLLNYKEYIVDKFGDLAPYGVIGELYIGGAGVAKGYKNLDEMTAQKFIDFCGERVYKSGDYAKWDKDGNVIILGRLDNQVKLRGLRIELGEIEGLMEAQPHIKKASVVIRKLNNQDNLCAYFTADTAIDVEALRDELKKTLTHYMVPTAYLQMAEMPMTDNGKTNIRLLPDPIPVTLAEYIAPANDTEKFFCEAFRKALHLDRVGALDNFFEIGGTSLVVTSVVLEASENGYPITYGDIFKCNTPRALAELFSEGTPIETGGLFDFDNYDYSKINALLEGNTVEAFLEGESREIGNVLITGATGYMGMHLLAQYLSEESGTAYCMIRKGRYKSVRDRLKSMMYYYFDEKYSEDFDNRVVALEGDVTDYALFEQCEKLPINTVFNCAANVKHFSSGTDIEDINVGGAVNCAKLCEKINARLIHFSTVSVSGTTEDPSKLTKQMLDERSLYFGQTLDNKYTSSKLMGERMVLEAAAERGLDAKIIRVGTLAARESDGEFQINFLTNNFMGRLRSYSILGCFPYTMFESPVCMGPIDTSCEAFLRLSRTPKACCVFNAVNNHTLPLGDIIRQMNKNGMNIRMVEYEEFSDALTEAQKDPEKAAILSSMTAYMNLAHGKTVIMVPFESHYTTQILARTGFFWNASNEKYVMHFINALEGFRFFDKDNLNR